MATIHEQVYDALSSATLENQYPHEYERNAGDIVLEIHDWSGILDFDQNNSEHLGEGMDAVFDWRRDHPQ